MRTQITNVDLGTEPQLLIGRRESGKKLSALRVKLHNDVSQALASLCQPTVAKLRTYTERPFEIYAALDEEEYFWKDFEVDDEDEANLVALVRSAETIPFATKAQIESAAFTFYAICWRRANSMVGFVSHSSPTTALRHGALFFQYGQTMRSVARPSLALTPGADLVIGTDGVAILKPNAFQSLFGDVGVQFESVPADVVGVRESLRSKIALSTMAETSLNAVGGRTQKIARRLRSLSGRIDQIDLTPSSLSKSLRRHKINPRVLLNATNQFEFGEERVEMFLDAIDSRYFEDDFTEEERRADRFSRRPV